MPVKWRQNLAVTGRGSYYKEERLEEFLDGKGAFYNGNESDNDYESYRENNEQQQLPESFANSCYKIVPPIFYFIIYLNIRSYSEIAFFQINRLYINTRLRQWALISSIVNVG